MTVVDKENNKEFITKCFQMYNKYNKKGIKITNPNEINQASDDILSCKEKELQESCHKLCNLMTKVAEQKTKEFADMLTNVFQNTDSEYSKGKDSSNSATLLSTLYKLYEIFSGDESILINMDKEGNSKSDMTTALLSVVINTTYMKTDQLHNKTVDLYSAYIKNDTNYITLRNDLKSDIETLQSTCTDILKLLE